MTKPDAPDTPTGPSVRHDPPQEGRYATGDLTFEPVRTDGHDVVLARVENGAEVRLIGGLFPIWDYADRDLTVTSPAFDGLWPMQVGKKDTFTIREIYDNGAQATYSFSAHVIERTEVTTEAGTFDAYLVWSEVNQENEAYTALSKIWYAPALGLPVKREQSHRVGYGMPRDYELTSYERP